MGVWGGGVLGVHNPNISKIGGGGGGGGGRVTGRSWGDWQVLGDLEVTGRYWEILRWLAGTGRSWDDWQVLGDLEVTGRYWEILRWLAGTGRSWDDWQVLGDLEVTGRYWEILRWLAGISPIGSLSYQQIPAVTLWSVIVLTGHVYL